MWCWGSLRGASPCARSMVSMLVGFLCLLPPNRACCLPRPADGMFSYAVRRHGTLASDGQSRLRYFVVAESEGRHLNQDCQGPHAPPGAAHDRQARPLSLVYECGHPLANL